MMNFIKTQNAETADRLRQLGMSELPKQDQYFVFVNNGKTVFACDEKKVVFTNILTI